MIRWQIATTLYILAAVPAGMSFVCSLFVLISAAFSGAFSDVARGTLMHGPWWAAVLSNLPYVFFALAIVTEPPGWKRPLAIGAAVVIVLYAVMPFVLMILLEVLKGAS